MDRPTRRRTNDRHREGGPRNGGHRCMASNGFFCCRRTYSANRLIIRSDIYYDRTNRPRRSRRSRWPPGTGTVFSFYLINQTADIPTTVLTDPLLGSVFIVTFYVITMVGDGTLLSTPLTLGYTDDYGVRSLIVGTL